MWPPNEDLLTRTTVNWYKSMTSSKQKVSKFSPFPVISLEHRSQEMLSKSKHLLEANMEQSFRFSRSVMLMGRILMRSGNTVD